ncbi:hypothetical protein TRFO_43179 [Tritrichomonas foetus]|uniref:Uncharacterized protein n=1 Tax=Tritrichomonas foetus TaxID=1144522 RepID=A0A1J4KS01_9EUKA|nr:hypothetical protein TRFO_43179 [Tritrichomonas foetus]|eukprot:OHT14043.1 hypothetical protein TRFO_43179 [Tritrichomonas foetus]
MEFMKMQQQASTHHEQVQQKYHEQINEQASAEHHEQDVEEKTPDHHEQVAAEHHEQAGEKTQKNEAAEEESKKEVEFQNLTESLTDLLVD